MADYWSSEKSKDDSLVMTEWALAHGINCEAQQPHRTINQKITLCENWLAHKRLHSNALLSKWCISVKVPVVTFRRWDLEKLLKLRESEIAEGRARRPKLQSKAMWPEEEKLLFGAYQKRMLDGVGCNMHWHTSTMLALVKERHPDHPKVTLNSFAHNKLTEMMCAGGKQQAFIRAYLASGSKSRNYAKTGGYAARFGISFIKPTRVKPGYPQVSYVYRPRNGLTRHRG